MAKKKPDCPICGCGPANTKEDITSTWSRKAYIQRLRESGEITSPEYPRNTMPMCEVCNGKFGAAYEDRVAPILTGPVTHGDAVSLDPDQQSIVSQWVVVKHFMGRLNRAEFKSEEWKICNGILRMMMDFPGMPHEFGSPFRPYWPLISIRLGTIDPVRQDEGAVEARLIESVPNPEGIEVMYSFLAHLVVELAIAGEQDVHRDYVAATPDNPWLTRIWPVSGGNVQWPPARTTTRAEFYALRAAVAPRTLEHPAGEPTRSDVGVFRHIPSVAEPGRPGERSR